MKEFEKWNKEKPGYYPLLKNTITEERKLDWKAALEWVISQGDRLFESDRHGYYYDISASLIKDELED